VGASRTSCRRCGRGWRAWRPGRGGGGGGRIGWGSNKGGTRREGRADLRNYDGGSHVGSIMRGEGAGAGRGEEIIVVGWRTWIVKERGS